MERSLNSYVTVFAGSRDHYEVARALYEGDQLESLVTDFYTPDRILKYSGPFRRLLARRHSPGLPSGAVHISWPAVFCDITSRFTRKAGVVAKKDEILGRMAGRLATTKGCSLLAYSYYASYAFEAVSAKTRKVIFQVHPHPVALRELYFEELRRFPRAASSLLAEAEMNYGKEAVERLSREALLADFVITPGSYAKQTLLRAGVPNDRIAVVPYGISTERYPKKSFSAPKEKLRLLFVGSMIQRKGIGYLIQAIDRLRKEPVELVMVGRGGKDDALLEACSGLPIRVVRAASHERLVEEMQGADVFVLPSLAESFALVILEAMAVGLPVITTQHTAGPDLLTEGETGFVGPIRDVDYLEHRIRWFINHREQVSRMGRLCQEVAREYTWERFRAGVRSALARFGEQGGVKYEL